MENLTIRKLKMTRVLILICLLPFFLWGCFYSTKNYSVYNNAVKSGNNNVRKAGVLPFINETGRQGAGEIVTNSFNTALFKTGKFEVEEKGNIERFLIRSRIRDISKISVKQLNRLGENLRLDAVFIGTVEEFWGGDQRTLSMTPIVSVRVRLIDVKTGRILWMMRHRRSGDEYVKVFDFGRVRTVSELTKRLTMEVVKTI